MYSPHFYKSQGRWPLTVIRFCKKNKIKINMRSFFNFFLQILWPKIIYLSLSLLFFTEFSAVNHCLENGQDTFSKDTFEKDIQGKDKCKYTKTIIIYVFFQKFLQCSTMRKSGKIRFEIFLYGDEKKNYFSSFPFLFLSLVSFSLIFLESIKSVKVKGDGQ